MGCTNSSEAAVHKTIAVQPKREAVRLTSSRPLGSPQTELANGRPSQGEPTNQGALPVAKLANYSAAAPSDPETAPQRRRNVDSAASLVSNISSGER